MTDISPESELDDVSFKVNMRTSYLTASAEKLVDIESGGTKQIESTTATNTGRRQSIISGIVHLQKWTSNDFREQEL